MKVDLLESTQIIKIYNIISYEIIAIHLTPLKCANLELLFYCDDNNIYNKKYLLENKEYFDWLSDDYLDYFVTNNIEKIFNN